MHVKSLGLAAALALSQFVPAKSDEVFKFHPYVSLGSVCGDKLADSRLTGVPVPLGSTGLDCGAQAQGATSAADRPVRLVFDARSGRIVGTRPYGQ
jgi:hypothetical protein